MGEPAGVVVDSTLLALTENPTSTSKLEDLPHRLLGKILSFIPTNDHSLLKEVSPGWKKLIDEHIGVSIYIGRVSDYKLDRFDFDPIEQIENIGISILYLINVHNTILPNFKFPNLVKQITFIDYISEKNFLHVLEQLTNLRSLSIDMSTCHYLEFNNISLDFLIRLETIAICTNEYCSEWNEEVHPSKNEVQISLDNLNNLLTHNHFHNLKNLLIGFPIVSPVSGNIKFITHLFKCILIHYETLRHLEIFYDGKLESVIENPLHSIKSVDINYDDLKCVQLHDIFINLHEFHREHNLIEPWLNLLNLQIGLKRCIFIPRGGDEDECIELPLPIDLFKQQNTCTSTLVVFKWFLVEAESGQDGLIIDCKIFQKCILLADINLTSSGNNPSNIINMSYLPASIQRVCFEGILCLTDDLELLVADFPSLQKLSLTSIGEDNTYGMDIETLRGIYERKTLTRLLILDGFNKSSIRVATQQEESSFSFVVMLLKTKFYEGDCYFHMKLCENGEYAVIQ